MAKENKPVDLSTKIGLGDEKRSEWPEPPRDMRSTMDILKPGSKEHETVRDYVMRRLTASEHEMRRFHSRWQAAEQRVQAYINLTDWEQILQDANDLGEPPKAVNIVVPHTYATVMTIVTYLIHTFGGRKPMFQVGSNKASTVEGARHMETMLQYYADHVRLIKLLFQYFQDGEIYGLQAMRVGWREEWRYRTVYKSNPLFGYLGELMGLDKKKTRELRMVYSGNEAANIDPFMFFPDFSVPMHEVNRRGEYVFWREYIGLHALLSTQAEGRYRYIDSIGEIPDTDFNRKMSNRGVRAGGEGHAGEGQPGHWFTQKIAQVDQGSVVIIPRELGIGEKDYPEKWLFTIANKKQIIAAQPLDNDHDMHPVVVGEPYTLGYGFGQLGIVDLQSPFQDVLSWLLNSHMDNVKTALNNMFIVDPSMIEMQDLKEPGAGKLIRLKKSMYGKDVRTALYQLNVQDITRNHISDFEQIMRMSDSLSSVTDNLRGLQDGGGRKTATEVRTSGEAAASRLAAHARIISAQSVVDLTEMWSLNTQQYLDDTFFLEVVGEKGNATPIHISPEMLVGDFHYPVHDGTLPLDRVAMLDIWKELFLGIAQDQELRMNFDMPGIFEWIGELGGAKNLSRFRIQPQFMPDEQAGDMALQGQGMQPLVNHGQTPGVVSNPRNRAAGGQ